MLLEALCGATYQEIVDDYMLTYANYYGITEDSDPQRYETIKAQNLDAMIEAVVSDESVDITDADLSGYAKDYLIGIGVNEETVEKIKEELQNEQYIE